MRKRFFAVASLGKGRWYWVVWPSAEEVQAGEGLPHVAEGYEETKAEAVDRALEVAGMHGAWLAAGHARQYQRQRSRGGGEGGLGAVEVLYHDVQDRETGSWFSLPHRVVRKTRRYVYVEQRPYDPERLAGGWLDLGAPTYRLDREALEREGHAFVPITAEIDDPLFFGAPYEERVERVAAEVFPCFRRLGLSFPCTVDQVKAAYRRLAKDAHPDRGGSHDGFLALQEAYEQALRLCRYGQRGGPGRMGNE